MSDKYKIRNKILIAVAIIIIATIPISFLYSLIMLIIQPSSMFVVENRKDI